MTLEQAKKELIKRYKYLYENASFILAPFMVMRDLTLEELKISQKLNSQRTYIIYLDLNINHDIIKFLEEFLLSDMEMEYSTLYQMIERNKQDKDYQERGRRGLELLDKDNQSREYCKEELDLHKILGKVTNFVRRQSDNLKNKNAKIAVLDEYYRIHNYKNDGKIYASGLGFCIEDFLKGNSAYIPIEFGEELGIGVPINSFISTIANTPHYEYNCSIFTEGEKQAIYLQYHDELPCDLEITCELEEQYVETLIDSRLTRPESTNPCGNLFTIKEEAIFINPNDPLYRYFHICPHCGYIVNIPKEKLSEGIKARIEARCEQDPQLFERCYTYSKLYGLEKDLPKNSRRLLTRKDSK